MFTAEMPKFLASLLFSLNQRFPMQQTERAAENITDTDDSAIDLDFIGG